MKNFSAVLALLTLSGCFLSDGTDDPTCTAAPACDPGDVAVRSCDGVEGCYQSTLCGLTIDCAPAGACEGAIPVCRPGEDQVSRCGGAECRTVTECGTTIYCEPECTWRYCAEPPGMCFPSCPGGYHEVPACTDEAECYIDSSCEFFPPVSCEVDPPMCDAYPACPPLTMEVGSCDPADPSCTVAEACGSVIYCYGEPECESAAPCYDAESDVLESGTGVCLDITSPGAPYHCYEQELCGETYYCVTACPAGSYQIGGPAECSEGRCTVYEHPEGLAWCAGGGEACLAIPTCSDVEEQIDLALECDDASTCRYVSICGQTIQCRQGL